MTPPDWLDGAGNRRAAPFFGRLGCHDGSASRTHRGLGVGGGGSGGAPGPP